MRAKSSVARVLDVPSLPCVVDPRTFDAWAWCASDTLVWRRPFGREGLEDRDGARLGREGLGDRDGARLDRTTYFDGSNPAGLVFVMHAECTFLPRELARLHAEGYGLEDEWALAPYGIDDATDGLFEHRVRPRDVFWLAAPTLGALVWGLHDWAHFHNHGPFDDPPTTELQCDLVALAWLRANREVVGLDDADLTEVARGLARLSHCRFEEAGRAPPVADLGAVFAGDYPRAPLGR